MRQRLAHIRLAKLDIISGNAKWHVTVLPQILHILGIVKIAKHNPHFAVKLFYNTTIIVFAVMNVLMSHYLGSFSRSFVDEKHQENFGVKLIISQLHSETLTCRTRM